MKTLMKTISTGMYLPSKVTTNFDLSKIVETSDEWITTRTGIKERRYAVNETVSDLAYYAALDAINNANDKNIINEIDLIIVATMTSETKSPSVANMVQSKLGLNDNQVTAFDINAACSGFVYALELAATLLSTKKYRKALVIGSEKMTNVLNFEDRNTCILFGDGAGALIAESTNDENNASYFYNDSKGDVDNYLVVNKYLEMNGPKVYQFAIDVIPKAINEVLEKANLTLDDIDVFVPHQANLRIIESMIKTLNID